MVILHELVSDPTDFGLMEIEHFNPFIIEFNGLDNDENNNYGFDYYKYDQEFFKIFRALELKRNKNPCAEIIKEMEEMAKMYMPAPDLKWETIEYPECLKFKNRKIMSTKDFRIYDSTLFKKNGSKKKFVTHVANIKHLKGIKLLNFPIDFVRDIIDSPDFKSNIEVFHAKIAQRKSMLTSPTVLDLSCLRQMPLLTEIKITSSYSLELTSLPSLEDLVNLKVLSLNSILHYPSNIYERLGTVTKDLQVLEIGCTDYFTTEFSVALRRFENLISLKLETVFGTWDYMENDIFEAIRSLKNLRHLELVNIKMTPFIKSELEKCDGIRALLIVPDYGYFSGTIGYTIECLENLRKTLTHVVLGLTTEVMYGTDYFVNDCKRFHCVYGYKYGRHNIKTIDRADSKKDKLPFDYRQYGSMCIAEFEKQLSVLLRGTKTRVVHRSCSSKFTVGLSEVFNDLYI